MQPIPQPITSPQHMASRLGRILLLLAIVAPLVWTPPARAATTLTVVSSADSGAGTLREAIASAEPGDTIVFAESLADQAIALGSTLVIDKNLTIGDADAALQVIISGEHAVRILEVRSGVEVALGGLALVKGKVEHGDGGAIWNGGTLTLANCIVNAHYGEVGGAIYNADTGHLTITDSLLGGSQATMQGGAIYNGGTLVLLRSTIDYNVAAVQGGSVVNDSTGTMLVTQSTLDSNFTGGLGGAIVSQGALAIVQSTLSRNGAAHGGALFTAGQATVTNSTFAENAATGEVEVPGDLWFGGGGIANLGDLLLHHVTLAGNTAPEGLAGGLSHVAATLRMANTLIADSSPSADCQVRPVPGAPAGTIDLNVGNLIGDGSCDAPLSGDPLLGPLGDHGGPTQTVFLLPGSPAINAGDEGSRADIDQRGVDRLQGGTLCDIGAVEMRAGRVATMPAGDVTAQAATLRGEAIVPDLAVTTFQYGTTTDYGSTVETSPAMHEAQIDATFSTFLWGLAANTTYHYRAVADTGAVVAFGEDVTFTTPTRPPKATTVPAMDVTREGGTLRGTANAENAETTVAFEYGLDTAYGETLDATPAMVTGIVSEAVTCTVTGLLPNTTYHYRAVGTNVGGPAYGEDRAFATAPVAPVVATDSAGDVTEASAVLHGTVNARNDETAVTFRYGLVSGAYEHTATTESVAGLEDTLVSAALSGLAPNTTYYYRVEAANAGGETYGEERTFATGLAAPVALTEPADGITETGATLRATVNARNADTAIHFQYGLGTAYGETAVADPDTVSGLDDATASAVLAGLAPSTTYHFRVVATNGAGATYGEDATFTTGQVAPLATTEDATEVTGTSATLHGTVNAQNDDATILFEYGLDDAYGESAPADPATASGSGDTAVSCVLTGLLPGATYHFRVVATNGAGTTEGEDRTLTTAAVAPVSTTGAAGDVTISGAMLHGTVNAQNSVTDAWFEYAPGDAAWESAPAEPASVSGMGDVAVTLALAGLAPDTLYRYRVVAENAGGITTGEPMTFTTGIPVPVARTEAATEIGTTTAILHATVNGLGQEVAVRFEYGPDTGYGASIAAAQTPLTVAADTAVTAALEGLAPGTTYHYRVVAESAGGLAEGEDLTFTTATDEPHAPVYLVYPPLARP